MRHGPMMWDDEAPQGVLSPFEGRDALEGDQSLSLLGLPSGEAMIRSRDVSADAAAGPAVHAALGKIADALAAAAARGVGWRYRLDGLSEEQRAVLLDALGEGEVSVVIAGGAPDEGVAHMAETILPGVWVGRAEDVDGAVKVHWVEVGDAPRALRETALTRPRADLAIEALTAPHGAMNVMAVLAEIRERAQAWTPGTPNHVLNFTLFPMTEADTAFLAKVLGETGVRIASGGYGAARVVMTALRHVWGVQYLNGMGTVILDTVEVGDIPASVLASREDFEDSAMRLNDIREAYAP